MNDDTRGRLIIEKMGYELIESPLLPADGSMYLARATPCTPQAIIARSASAVARGIGRAFGDDDLMWIGRVPFDDLVNWLVGSFALKVEPSAALPDHSAS